MTDLLLRAPMRARHVDVPPGAGAELGLRRGLVGIGDALPERPRTLEAAVAAATAAHGEKAGRMLRRFAALPDGALLWTRDTEGLLHLGRLTGPWRYEDAPEARRVGLHHVRPAAWLDRPFGEPEVPPAVAATFARGGRNLQRIRDPSALRRSLELWRG